MYLQQDPTLPTDRMPTFEEYAETGAAMRIIHQVWSEVVHMVDAVKRHYGADSVEYGAVKNYGREAQWTLDNEPYKGWKRASRMYWAVCENVDIYCGSEFRFDIAARAATAVGMDRGQNEARA